MEISKSISRIIGLIALFLIIMLGGKLLEPPKVRTSNTADQFDTVRAFSRIETILGDETPHPVDSAANAVVRERLMTQIRALGLTPDVTVGPACNRGRSYFMACSTVTNVAFRMGPEPTPGKNDTIMVTTHYDSVPAGPGAADASIGTATLLEIAAVLKGQTLERPLLFMFTDGEEGGLMGAHYFVRDDPRADEVKTMVNFEARGNRGPAYMFETSRPNGRVIPAYAKTVARPSANSVMSAVYEIIPNTTDVAVYLPKGYEALNFAVVDGYAHYHTPHDNLENLSARSLQHMGDQGLSAVLSLASESASTNNKHYLYADILTRFMIYMPKGFGLFFIVAALIIAARYLQISIAGSKRWRVLAAVPLAFAVAALDIWILQWIINALRTAEPYWWAHGWATKGMAAALAILGALFVIRLLCPKATPAQLTFAGWIWFLIFGLICNFVLPGAMILFALPAIAFLIASLIWRALRKSRPGAFEGLFDLAMIFTLIIFTPLFSALGITLGYGTGFMFTLVFGIALLPALGLFASDETAKTLDVSVWGFAGLAAVFFAAALMLPSASVKTPAPLNVVTYANQDNGETHIGFTGTRNAPDFGDMTGLEERYLPGRRWETWSVPTAASTPLKAPELVDVSRTEMADGKVKMTAKIKANGADRVGIMLPKSMGAIDAEFSGITGQLRVGKSFRSNVILRCAGLTCDGSNVSFTYAKKEVSPGWGIYGEHFQSTGAAQSYIDARPETYTPIQSGDHTVVFATVNP